MSNEVKQQEDHKMPEEVLRTEFLTAAYARDYDGMREALARGDKNSLYNEDHFGNTALHYATWGVESLDKAPKGDWLDTNPARWKFKKDKQDQSANEMVLFLLSLDKEQSLINKPNKGGWSPLHYAALLNLTQTVKTFMEHKAEVNITAKEGMKHHGNIPLICAAHGWKDTKTGTFKNYNFDTIKVLLDNGADIINLHHSSPLLVVCKGRTRDDKKFFDMDTDSQMKQIDVIKIMLEKVKSLKLNKKALEAFLNRKDKDGESAVTHITYNICSMQSKNTNDQHVDKELLKIVKKLLSWGASMQTKAVSWTPTYHNSKQHSRLPFQGGGWTPLNYACHINRADVAKVILSKENRSLTPEYLDAKDFHGETALTYAVANGLTEVIPDLLSRGASLYHLNGDKWQIHGIDKESFRVFLDDQISVKKVKLDPLDNEDRTSHKVADTEIEFSYQRLHRNLEVSKVESTEEKPQDASMVKIIEKDAEIIPMLTQTNTLLTIDQGTANSHDLKFSYTTKDVMEDMVKISPDHKELLKHPLFMALLKRKWKKIEHIYLLWMFIKIIFLCLLLTVIVMEGQTLKDNRQNSTESLKMEQIDLIPEISNMSLMYLVPFTFLLLFMFIVELFQIGISASWWVQEIKNWFQLIILATGGILAYDLLKKDPSTAQLDLHILGMLLPFVFYEFLRELGYHPSTAKYILLLDKVCKTFFWYGIIYVGLVITPAISFFLIVDQKESVYPTDFSKLLAKTFVMFVGEVELFDVAKSEAFQWLEIVFFLIFIFFLAVVLMNLLNALAIVDTKELVEDAEMEMLSSLLETVSFWENLKEKDPHNRLSKSFLSKLKVRPYLSYLIPDLACYSDDKFIKIRPFGKSRNTSHLLTFFKRMKEPKKQDESDRFTEAEAAPKTTPNLSIIVGENEVQKAFGRKMGKDIVKSALDIYNEKEEAERIRTNVEEEVKRNEKKEKDEMEENQRKEEEMEEWKMKISQQLNTILSLYEGQNNLMDQ